MVLYNKVFYSNNSKRIKKKKKKKKNRSVFASMPSMLHQCVTSLSELSVFGIKKDIASFFRYH